MRLPHALRLAPLAAALALAVAAPAQAQDKFTYMTNWYAQAEHGGFYQAVAEGIYKKHGLDVTIKMGGPQVNITQMMAAGQADCIMGSSDIQMMQVREGGVPVVNVAAFFQKDPQVLIAHPGQGNDTLEALKGKPILIAPAARATFWNFLRVRYGYTDDQIRTYTFNMAPFLADKKAIQEGYLTSEPHTLEKTGIKPVVHVLADHGFDSYSTTLECTRKLMETRPDLVQRFVDASIEGWYSYLYGDPAPANALIRRDNPEMTPDLLAYGLAAMRRHGVVDSGDALKLGIGAMTDARWNSFAASMIKAGVYPPTIDVSKAYTLRFVDKRVGMELKAPRAARPRP